jgi:hypothetical protein
MRLRTLAVLAAFLCVGPSLRAQEEAPPPVPVVDPKVVVQDLARWVDDRVFGVGVVDVHRLDLGWVLQQFADAVGRVEAGEGIDTEDTRDTKADVLKGKELAEKWVADYTGAGGREGWMLLAPAQALVVPIHEESDAGRLSKLLEVLEIEGRTAVRERNGVLVTGNPLRGLPLSAAPRAEQISEALGACKDIDPVARFVLIPTDNHKLFLATLIPQIKATTDVDIPQGLNLRVKWASIAVSAPPTPEVRAVIQATTHTAAQQIAAIANQLMSKAVESSPYQAINEVGRELKWIANEDRAELRANASQVKRFTAAAAAPLVKARIAARQMKIMAQSRQVLIGVHTYAVDKQDALPATLDDLQDYLGGPGSLEHPDGRGWKLLAPAKRLSQIADPATTVLVHEDYKTWPRKGIAVGFVDGHVEWVQTEDRLKELLQNR